MNPKRKMMKRKPDEPGYHPSDNLCLCRWCGKQKKPDEMEWECREAFGKCIECFEKGVSLPHKHITSGKDALEERSFKGDRF